MEGNGLMHITALLFGDDGHLIAIAEFERDHTPLVVAASVSLADSHDIFVVRESVEAKERATVYYDQEIGILGRRVDLKSVPLVSVKWRAKRT